MGMFDGVNVMMDCPKCGATIRKFQSKGGPCCLLHLSPDEVDNFYSRCSLCHAFVEFVRGPVAVVRREQPFTREEVEAMGFRLLEDEDEIHN